MLTKLKLLSLPSGLLKHMIEEVTEKSKAAGVDVNDMATELPAKALIDLANQSLLADSLLDAIDTHQRNKCWIDSSKQSPLIPEGSELVEVILLVAQADGEGGYIEETYTPTIGTYSEEDGFVGHSRHKGELLTVIAWQSLPPAKDESPLDHLDCDCKRCSAKKMAKVAADVLAKGLVEAMSKLGEDLASSEKKAQDEAKGQVKH
ncbi:hypothetical protein A134_23260 [Vibrio crassostreae 9CS106]|uniref:Uncharacterized protein n=1 Tax=Vibrio crassostreae 9CS106 TaxID=1191300 RepID=A0A1B1C3D1_9VIBR|nr:hypothetical protein A134_23260 [Vibrio crassostreae 9CS106]